MTAQLYPILPHSHMGRNLTGQAPCGSLFGTSRQQRAVPTDRPSRHYAPAGAGRLGNWASIVKLGTIIKLVPHVVQTTIGNEQPY